MPVAAVAAAAAGAAGEDSVLSRFHRRRRFQEARSSSVGSSSSTSRGLASAGTESVVVLADVAVKEERGREVPALVAGRKDVTKELAPPPPPSPPHEGGKSPWEGEGEDSPRRLEPQSRPGGADERADDGKRLHSAQPAAPVNDDKGSGDEECLNAGEVKTESPQTPSNRKESPVRRKIRITLSRDELFEFGVLGPVSMEGSGEGEDIGDGGDKYGLDSSGQAGENDIGDREEREASALSAVGAAATADAAVAVAAESREAPAPLPTVVVVSSPAGKLYRIFNGKEGGPGVKNEAVVEPGGEGGTSGGIEGTSADRSCAPAVGAIGQSIQGERHLDVPPAPAGEGAQTEDLRPADEAVVGPQQQSIVVDEAMSEAVAASAPEARATAVAETSLHTGEANGGASPIRTMSSASGADGSESYMTPVNDSPPEFWSAVGGESGAEKSTGAGRAGGVGTDDIGVEIEGPAEASSVAVPSSESEEDVEATAAEAAAPRGSFFGRASPAAAVSPAIVVASAASPAAGEASPCKTSGEGGQGRAAGTRAHDGTRLLSMESFQEIISGDPMPASSPQLPGGTARLSHIAEEAKEARAEGAEDAAALPAPSGIASRPRAAKAASPPARPAGRSGSPPRRPGTPPRALKVPAPASPGDMSASLKQQGQGQQRIQATATRPTQQKQGLPSPLREAEVGWSASSPRAGGSSDAAAATTPAADAQRSPRRRACLSPGPSRGMGGGSPLRRLSGAPGPRRNEVTTPGICIQSACLLIEVSVRCFPSPSFLSLSLSLLYSLGVFFMAVQAAQLCVCILGVAIRGLLCSFSPRPRLSAGEYDLGDSPANRPQKYWVRIVTQVA